MTLTSSLTKVRCCISYGALIVLLATSLVAKQALAQPCITCRTEKCPNKAGMTEWCGQGKDPQAPAKHKSTKTPKKRPSSTATSQAPAAASEPKAVSCPIGQVSSPATANHCCWLGQTWNEARRTCSGIPTACPAGTRIEGEECTGSCPVGMAFVFGGTYASSTEQATLANFCLDQIETTVASYAACVAVGQCTPPASGELCNNVDRANHPVNCVDWFQADIFCRSQGKRLPTDREWEWAARGGNDERLYPWGSGDPGGRACWNGPGNTRGKADRLGTCAVGSYPLGISLSGVFDLAGNVWEWVSSDPNNLRPSEQTPSTLADPYATTNSAATASDPSRELHVLRGGGWADSAAANLRADLHILHIGGGRSSATGFRCARNP